MNFDEVKLSFMYEDHIVYFSVQGSYHIFDQKGFWQKKKKIHGCLQCEHL